MYVFIRFIPSLKWHAKKLDYPSLEYMIDDVEGEEELNHFNQLIEEGNLVLFADELETVDGVIEYELA